MAIFADDNTVEETVEAPATSTIPVPNQLGLVRIKLGAAKIELETALEELKVYDGIASIESKAAASRPGTEARASVYVALSLCKELRAELLTLKETAVDYVGGNADEIAKQKKLSKREALRAELAKLDEELS